MRETVERKLNICKTFKRVFGLARTAKQKATPPSPLSLPATRKGKGKNKGKGTYRAKARARTKERVNNIARNGIRISREGGARRQTKNTQTGQEHTEWTETRWDHADNWKQTGGRATGA